MVYGWTFAIHKAKVYNSTTHPHLLGFDTWFKCQQQVGTLGIVWQLVPHMQGCHNQKHVIPQLSWIIANSQNQTVAFVWGRMWVSSVWLYDGKLVYCIPVKMKVTRCIWIPNATTLYLYFIIIKLLYSTTSWDSWVTCSVMPKNHSSTEQFSTSDAILAQIVWRTSVINNLLWNLWILGNYKYYRFV